MSRDLDTRLNALLDRLTDEDLLAGRGIGNEISIYIFEYEAADELRVRRYIPTLMEHLPKRRPGLRVAHVNLFELMLEYLQEREKLEKSLAMGRKDGDAALLKSLSNGLLKPEKLRPLLVEHADPANHDLVLISGVGGIFPVIRTHGLLNNIHVPMERTPILLFYPGRYDGKDLRIFGQSTLAKNYYRAFRIEP